jgi:hypothetical protein
VVARALFAEVDAGSAPESASQQRFEAVRDCHAIGLGLGPVAEKKPATADRTG